VLRTMVVADVGRLLAIGNVVRAVHGAASRIRICRIVLGAGWRFLCWRSQSRDREALQPSPGVRRWGPGRLRPLTFTATTRRRPPRCPSVPRRAVSGASSGRSQSWRSNRPRSEWSGDRPPSKPITPPATSPPAFRAPDRQPRSPPGRL
jgi:hypothetical protein